MKAITEEQLRLELRNTQPDTYFVPEGKLLTPAAREYLQQRKIKIGKGEGNGAAPRIVATELPPVPEVAQTAPAMPKPKYIDYETGAFYLEKPEHMTQLVGNKLVPKDHPRILFRGKLDSLQALVVLDQALIAEGGGSKKLIDDLADVLHTLREMMRCDVLDEIFQKDTVIGLTHACKSLSPETVCIPFRQHIGKSASPVRSVGDAVEKGDLLAAAADGISANIHASISGVVTEIDENGARIIARKG